MHKATVRYSYAVVDPEPISTRSKAEELPAMTRATQHMPRPSTNTVVGGDDGHGWCLSQPCISAVYFGISTKISGSA